MSNPSRKTHLSLAFLTILVDMIGFGAAFPILPILFSDEAHFFSGLRADRLPVWYGGLLSVFALAQFIGAPILGALSDRFGRRPVLLLSIGGSAIGYALFAYGIEQNSMFWLFAGRIIPGFAGGNVAIVFSSLADASHGRSKVKDFGLAGAAFGMGMILGPVLGGLLSDEQLHPSLGLHVPFVGMVLLTVFNFLVVWRLYPETNLAPNPSKVSPLSGFRNLVEAFYHPRLSLVFIAVLLQACGFSLFIQFVAFFLEATHGFRQLDIGLMFGYVGLLTALTQGFLVRPLATRFSSERLVANVIPGFALGILLLIQPTASWWLYVIIPLPTIFQGLYMPNMTAVVSNLSDREIQGRMLSINQSLTALSNAIPPLFGGWLFLIGARIPVYVAIAFSLAAWVVFNLFFQRHRKMAQSEHSTL
ncbi:MAG: MFS transporter [Bacteroidetes bacterium]|nr:MFS transporter [Bacteroidota bacterium]